MTDSIFKSYHLVTFHDGSSSKCCNYCKTIYDYKYIPHVCPESHDRLHECMRCGLIFECKNEGCQAQYKVLPMHIVDGVLVEHCPAVPSWDYIRELVEVRLHQTSFCEGYDGYGKCELQDGMEWRCHKKKGHKGYCSCHNDCGYTEGSTCGYPPDHCGKHANQK